MADTITLRDEIDAILTGMTGVTYMRAKPDEANLLLNQTKVTNCIAIHIDLTQFASMRTAGSYTYKVVPTQVLFLYKNTHLSDRTSDVDTLIGQAEDKADEFYDRLIQSAVIEQSAPLDDPTYSRLEAYKRFDAITSGILFEWLVPIPRSTYYCAT